MSASFRLVSVEPWWIPCLHANPLWCCSNTAFQSAWSQLSCDVLSQVISTQCFVCSEQTLQHVLYSWLCANILFFQCGQHRDSQQKHKVKVSSVYPPAVWKASGQDGVVSDTAGREESVIRNIHHLTEKSYFMVTVRQILGMQFTHV